MNDSSLHTDTARTGWSAVDADTDLDIDIDDIILSLNQRHASLSQYIDDHWDDLDPNHLARLLTLHANNTTRLGRLLRDHCAIYGKPEDPMDVIMNTALARAHAMLGTGPTDHEDCASLDDPHRELPIDMDHLITDLDAKQTRLCQYIENHQHDWDATNLSRLFTVYGQNAIRLGRLLRDRHSFYGEGLDRVKALAAYIDKKYRERYAKTCENTVGWSDTEEEDTEKD